MYFWAAKVAEEEKGFAVDSRATEDRRGQE